MWLLSTVSDVGLIESGLVEDKKDSKMKDMLIFLSVSHFSAFIVYLYVDLL